MKRRRDGSYSNAPDPDRDREYPFYHLIDGRAREDDRAAHRYLPAPVTPVMHDIAPTRRPAGRQRHQWRILAAASG